MKFLDRVDNIGMIELVTKIGIVHNEGLRVIVENLKKVEDTEEAP